jgi:hypothetical protein
VPQIPGSGTWDTPKLPTPLPSTNSANSASPAPSNHIPALNPEVPGGSQQIRIV